MNKIQIIFPDWVPNTLPGNGRRPLAYWHRHKKELLTKYLKVQILSEFFVITSKALRKFRDPRTEDEIDEDQQREHEIYMQIKKEIDDPSYNKQKLQIKTEPSF